MAVPSDTQRERHSQPPLTAEYISARALAESATLAEAVPHVLQAICEALDWDYGAVWNLDSHADVLRCVDTWHQPTVSVPEFTAVSRKMTFTRGVGLPGRVWASGEPAWIPDVVADRNFPRAAIARREGLHGAFALPILAGGRVVGVMEFFSREIREPDSELLRMLTTVGGQIGQFLEHKQAAEQLERFFALSVDPLCLAGFDGYFKRLNPVWERVLGYSIDELLARPYLDFVHPDDRHVTTEKADYLGVGGRVLKFENRYVAKDGSYRWFEWNAVPIESEQIIYAAARDVTERKQAKETIARYSRDLKAARQAEAANASQLARLVSELEVRDMLDVVKGALQSSHPQTIEVISALPGWVELVVPCTREAADQIGQVVERLGADLPEDVKESVAFAFRELATNAVEWGGQLNPDRKVRITCVRTDRLLMYRIADPGPGFSFDNLDHAAVAHPDNPIEHMNVRMEKNLRVGGYGLLTVRSLVDELVYNEKHNEVIFIKYLH